VPDDGVGQHSHRAGPPSRRRRWDVPGHAAPAPTMAPRPRSVPAGRRRGADEHGRARWTPPGPPRPAGSPTRVVEDAVVADRHVLVRWTCRPKVTLVVTRAPANTTTPSPSTVSAPTVASGWTSGGAARRTRCASAARTTGSPIPRTATVSSGRRPASRGAQNGAPDQGQVGGAGAVVDEAEDLVRLAAGLVDRRHDAWISRPWPPQPTMTRACAGHRLRARVRHRRPHRRTPRRSPRRRR